MNRAATIYCRGADMSEHDRQGLEAFMQTLRNYYGIPKDRAVFPATKADAPTPRVVGRPSSHWARNGAHHPWRAVVGRRRP